MIDFLSVSILIRLISIYWRSSDRLDRFLPVSFALRASCRVQLNMQRLNHPQIFIPTFTESQLFL